MKLHYKIDYTLIHPCNWDPCNWESTFANSAAVEVWPQQCSLFSFWKHGVSSLWTCASPINWWILELDKIWSCIAKLIPFTPWRAHLQTLPRLTWQPCFTVLFWEHVVLSLSSQWQVRSVLQASSDTPWSKNPSPGLETPTAADIADMRCAHTQIKGASAWIWT